MRIDSYEKRISEIDREYREHRLPPDQLTQRIRELREIFNATGNLFAEELAEIFQTAACHRANDCPGMYEAASRALKCSEKLGDFYYMVRSYTALGSYYGIMEDDTLTALDCFWNARVILMEHKDIFSVDDFQYLYEIVQNDIGCTLMYSGEYRMALDYFPMEEAAGNDDPGQKALLLINGAICLYRLNEWEEANRRIQGAKRIIPSAQHDAFIFATILVWEYLLAYRMGKMKEAEQALFLLDENAFSQINYATSSYLLEFFLENKLYDYFSRFYAVFLQNAIEENNTSTQITAYGYYMEYCRAIGDEAEYDAVCMEVGRLSIKRAREQAQMRRSSVRTYIHIAERAERQREMEKAQEVLRHKSEFDELTGLANRYRLLEFCKGAFAQAAAEGITLSVEILDVDHFKQVNDNYGHAQGDVCLKKLADELRKAVSDCPRQICARYGGDEFVIVRLGWSNREILSGMEYLKQAVQNMAIPNAYSETAPIVTVSQGAVNRIPSPGDELETFLRVADKCLYEAKKISRNAVVLGE